jgi:hypothetical protein
MPFGRTVAERIVQLGEGLRSGSIDIGGNTALCVLTFLYSQLLVIEGNQKKEFPPRIK